MDRLKEEANFVEGYIENLELELKFSTEEILMWRSRFFDSQGTIINEDRTKRMRNIFLSIPSHYFMIKPIEDSLNQVKMTFKEEL
jgi:hypothetical protein